MKAIKRALAVAALSLMAVMMPAFMLTAHAAPCNDFDKSILGVPTWYKYLEGEEVAGKCKPTLNASKDALPIGLAVLEAGMTLAGIVAAVFIFVGSFQYVLTQGEPDKANNAKKTIINAVIGLVIVIVSTRVVSFIAGRLG